MLIQSPLLHAIAHATAAQLRMQALVLIAVVVVAAALGTVVERSLRRLPDWRSAMRATLRYGPAFPLIALLLLLLVRHVDESVRSLELLKIAQPLLGVLLLVRVGNEVTRRLFANDHTTRLLVRAVSIGLWAVLLLHLSGLLPELRESLDSVAVTMGKQRMSLWTLLTGVAAVGITLLIALWVSSLLEARLMRTPIDASLRLVFTRLLRSVVLVVAVLTALQMVGIDLTVLGVFGGALGVGLGLGLQKIAANYVSGFVILLERSLRVGDNVRLDTFQGRIVDIKTRYTLVRSAAGIDAIIPNEQLIANRIENLSYSDPNVWLSTSVGVSYDTDIDKVLPLLREAALSVPRVLREPAPSAVLDNFGSDAINITVGYWISDPENGTLGVKGAVNLAIWRALKDAGIEIPFPQRVLHWAEGSAPAPGNGGPAAPSSAAR